MFNNFTGNSPPAYMYKFICAITGLCLVTILEVYPVTLTDDGAKAMQLLERARLLYEASDYDSLPYYYISAQFIFDGLQQYESVAECMLGMVDYHRMLNQQSEATRMLESAEEYIIQHFGQESESWADALFVRAKLYTGQNRSRESVSLLKSNLELQERINLDVKGRARVYNVIGAAYYTLGDFDSAEVSYQKSYETYMRISGEPSVEKGILLFNLGLVYSKRNDQHKWAEYAIQGIENNISLFGPEFPDLAENYNSLSSYYISIGKLDSARNYLNRAERIMINSYGKDYFELSRIYINRARIHKYEGNYQASLDYYQQAVSILENQEIPNRLIQNVVYVHLGNLYSSIREYQLAYDYLSRLLETKELVHPTRMAVFYTYIADVQTKLGNFAEAEGYMQEVFDIRRKFPFSNSLGLTSEYRIYGILMDSIGRSEIAGQYLKMALAVTFQTFGNNHFKTAGMHKVLGDYMERNDSLDIALDHYQRSIHTLVPEYNMMGLKQNPDPKDVSNLLFYLQVLKKKAGILEAMAMRSSTPVEKLEYSRAAYSAYHASIEIIGMLRTSYLNDESKLYLSDIERETYEKCLRTAFDCYKLSDDSEFLQKAFIVAEKAKYATLQSALHKEEALSLSGIPDSIRGLENGLKRQLSVYQALLMESQDDTLPDQVKVQQYRSEVFRLKDQMAGLYRSIEVEYPEYYRLLYRQEVTHPDKLMAMLGKRDKLIEYFIAGEEYYIFEISHSEIIGNRLKVDDSFLRDLDIVKRYIGGKSIRDTIRDDHSGFIESASRLYEVLIPSPERFKNLIIIPEGILSYFPFDVLITEPVPEFSGLYSEVPFLIRSHTIRYGYNAGLLLNQKPGKPGNLKRFVGFAPGYLKGHEDPILADASREIKINRTLLAALPGSIDEVVAIGRILRGEVFIETAASEGRFKDVAGESHIIHLATHAFLDDQDPLQSTLVFSENKQEREDGLLKVYELYNMSLKAKMVVLSACNTGLGELRGGEGIMSLARAFFYAGVPNIVMTLWTVSDLQSYELMVSFYRQLNKGRKAEIALRKAKLDFLDNSNPLYQHPRYWAGYILVGNPGHLFLPGFYRQLIAIPSIILLLLAGFYAWKNYFRKKIKD
ncbi:MAG TPA: CHAT domain-containing protein [Bacteroides sp.]|nr:CHAT domain-containing protein [Bacteroides sp.]